MSGRTDHLTAPQRLRIQLSVVWMRLWLVPCCTNAPPSFIRAPLAGAGGAVPRPVVVVQAQRGHRGGDAALRWHLRARDTTHGRPRRTCQRQGARGEVARCARGPLTLHASTTTPTTLARTVRACGLLSGGVWMSWLPPESGARLASAPSPRAMLPFPSCMCVACACLVTWRPCFDMPCCVCVRRVCVCGGGGFLVHRAP